MKSMIEWTIDRDMEFAYDISLKNDAIFRYFKEKERFGLDNEYWKKIESFNDRLSTIYSRLIYFEKYNSITRNVINNQGEIHYILDSHRTRHLVTITSDGVKYEKNWGILKRICDSGSLFNISDKNRLITVLEDIDNKIRVNKE